MPLSRRQTANAIKGVSPNAISHYTTKTAPPFMAGRFVAKFELLVLNCQSLNNHLRILEVVTTINLYGVAARRHRSACVRTTP